MHGNCHSALGLQQGTIEMAKRSSGRDALREQIKEKLEKNIKARVKQIAEQYGCDKETALGILRKQFTEAMDRNLKENAEKNEKRKGAKAAKAAMAAKAK